MRIGGHDIAGGGYELRGVLAAALPTAFDPHNTDFDVAVLYLDKASGNKAVRLQPGARGVGVQGGQAGCTGCVQGPANRRAPSAVPPPRNNPAPAAKPNPKFAWRQGTQLHVAGWGRLKWNGPLPKSLQEVRWQGMCRREAGGDRQCAPATPARASTRRCPLHRRPCQVSVDLLSPATCKRYLPRQDWQHNTMMCAGTPTRRRAACSGDSGGPLFRRGASATADVQVGIVSWGVQCGSQSLPGGLAGAVSKCNACVCVSLRVHAAADAVKPTLHLLPRRRVH